MRSYADAPMYSSCAVIICTKNRPQDLGITLSSLFNQSHLPGSLIVVDDSTGNETRELLETHPITTIITTRYIRMESPHTGLPAARNTGIRNLHEGTKIVLFLDDDVTLESGYIHNLCGVFKVNPDLTGVTGLITNGYFDRSFPEKIFLGFIGLINPVLVPVTFFSSRVTRTAEAKGPLFQKSGRTSIPAQWLSGCNMAYRTAIFSEGWRFDEQLTRYALGEDLIFSHTLYLQGKKLAQAYTAKLKHHSSPVERLPSSTALMMRFGYRRYAQALFSDRINIRSLYYVLFVAEFMAASFILSIRYRKNLSYFWETIQAFIKVRLKFSDIDKGSLESFNAIL